MSPRHLSRRKKHTQGIPNNVGIPKFLKPCEISSIKEFKQQNPDVSWDKAVERVVFESVPNLGTILAIS